MDYFIIKCLSKVIYVDHVISNGSFISRVMQKVNSHFS